MLFLPHHLPRPSWRSAHMFVAGALALAGLACGGGTTLIHPPTRASVASTIVVHTASASTAPSSPNAALTETASCAPGEQMVGGGFAASNVFEYAAFLAASYPSSPTSWSVTGSSISEFTLTALVYCAPLSPPLAVQIVRSMQSAAGAGGAACPIGSVLLGGGFRGTTQADAAASAVGQSIPAGAGWQAQAGQGTIQVFALCAGQHVRAGAVVQVAFTLRASSNGYNPDSAIARCPDGQVTLGGGFAGGGLVLASAANDYAFGAWGVTAGGNASETVYAVCVQLDG